LVHRLYEKHLKHSIKTLHNTFPPTSYSASKLLTATLMQEVVAI